MSDETISFRRATETDLDSIWSLLHANSQMLSDQKILEIMDQLFILEYQKRILGVLCGIYFNGQAQINWVVIHPLFPEKSLTEIMNRQFSALFCQESKNCLSGIYLLTNISEQIQKIRFLLKTEGAIHGIQDQ